MSLIRQLSVLAVCQILGDRADSLLGFLGERFSDHGGRLEGALLRANERAWRCLEVALAGDSWWDSCKSLLTAKDEQTLQRQIRLFLASLPPDQVPPGDAISFRRMALADLRGARQKGLVPGRSVSSQDVAADHAGVFARYGDPQALIDRDRQLVEGLTVTLHQEGYTHLARYVAMCPAGGKPLLVQAVRYFFRREVEADERLATGLTLEKLDVISTTQQAGFDGLHGALAEHGAKLEGLLEGLTSTVQATHEGVKEVSSKVTATMEVVTGARDDLKALQQRCELQSEQLQRVMGMLQEMLAGRTGQTTSAAAESPPAGEDLPPAPPSPQSPVKPIRLAPLPSSPPPTGFTPPESTLPAPAEATPEWSQVRQLLARVQRISPEERRRRPELARVVSELTETAQQLESTRRSVAQLQGTPPSGPLPIVPTDRPNSESAQAPAATRYVSSIFLTNTPPPAAEEAPPAEPVPEEQARTAKRRRLLSPLFDPEQGKK